MECLECDITVPSYPVKCTRTTLPGGVMGVAFAECGKTDFTLITDLSEWTTKKAGTTPDIFNTAMSRIMGSMPEPAEKMLKMDSCQPEELSGLTHTVEIMDYNSEDPTISFAQDAFWNFINKNYRKLEFGFLTCDERFYGFIKGVTVVAKRTVPADNLEKTFWKVTFKWNDINHAVPVLIPGLADVLEGQ